MVRSKELQEDMGVRKVIKSGRYKFVLSCTFLKQGVSIHLSTRSGKSMYTVLVKDRLLGINYYHEILRSEIILPVLKYRWKKGMSSDYVENMQQIKWYYDRLLGHI